MLANAQGVIDDHPAGWLPSAKSASATACNSDGPLVVSGQENSSVADLGLRHRRSPGSDDGHASGT